MTLLFFSLITLLFSSKVLTLSRPFLIAISVSSEHSLTSLVDTTISSILFFISSTNIVSPSISFVVCNAPIDISEIDSFKTTVLSLNSLIILFNILNFSDTFLVIHVISFIISCCIEFFSDISEICLSIALFISNIFLLTKIPIGIKANVSQATIINSVVFPFELCITKNIIIVITDHIDTNNISLYSLYNNNDIT